ncbi:MAG: TlpA family protein disulfide reductase [Calditrichia bacterium]|nr:TlpA family protein disulfide reductase [Calditrichia bacterium]MCK5454538.1 TlpA family protein disulfide reductase [Calditrichia bacterium]
MRPFCISFMVVILTLLPLIAQEDEGKLSKAPDFVLKDLEGKNYRLSENIGEGPIVISFWATWCVPCIEELKQMKRIYKKYSDMGVQFLAISIDDPKTVGRVNSFVKSHKYPYTVLLDTNNEIITLYQSKIPPYTVIIDNDGNVIYTHVGYRMGDEKMVDRELEKLFEE